MFVNSSSTTGNQWEFRPGTCETWAYLESIVHYWQTWKSITVLAPSMNGRLLSDFFPFCSTKCLGNFAVAVSNDLFFQNFKQSSWKQNKWCTLDTFFDSKKNWGKNGEVPRKVHLFMTSSGTLPKKGCACFFINSSCIFLCWYSMANELALKNSGLGNGLAWTTVGWPCNKNTFLGINYWKQTFWWHMQQYLWRLYCILWLLTL